MRLRGEHQQAPPFLKACGGEERPGAAQEFRLTPFVDRGFSWQNAVLTLDPDKPTCIILHHVSPVAEYVKRVFTWLPVPVLR